MITRRDLLALAAAAPLLGSGCQAAGGGRSSIPVPTVGPVADNFVLAGVDNMRRIAQLTGPGAINDTSKVLLAGCDLGNTFMDGDRTWFLFGDNFGIRKPDDVGGKGEVWKSNCLAWSTDTDFEDGITFDGWILDDLEQVKEILPGKKQPNGSGEVTKIPTQGWAIDGTLFAAFMSVRFWGEPGKWDANYSGLAMSTDHGENWEIVDGVQWPEKSGFIQLAQAKVKEGDTTYLYLWGVGGGRFGPMKLMRVPATVEAVQQITSYEYFAGTEGGAPRWSNSVKDAAVVLEGEIAEISVMWSTYLERWLVSTTTKNQAVLFEGKSPWGPFSTPHRITDHLETDGGFYAPYLCPRYVADEGKRLYFTLSIWNPYQVYWYAMDLRSTGGP